MAKKYIPIAGLMENEQIVLITKLKKKIAQLDIPLKLFCIENNMSYRTLCNILRETSQCSAEKLKEIISVFDINSIPDRFKQRWFLKLKNEHQVFYDYLERNAKKGGIWLVKSNDFSERTGHSINLEEFLNDINKYQVRISPLENNRWFLHYYVAENINPVFSIRYRGLISHLKYALDQGVPLDWIKGFRNPEMITKELIYKRPPKKDTIFHLPIK